MEFACSLVPVWVLTRHSSFRPQSKDMDARLTGDLTVVVCQPYDRLQPVQSLHRLSHHDGVDGWIVLLLKTTTLAMK